MNIINFKHESAELHLTKTMLDKHIIDANASIRNFARVFDIDMDKMKAGEKFEINATYLDGTETVLNFYRSKTRGDKRFSCKGIKSRVSAGDTLALTYKRNADGCFIIVINLTTQAGEIPKELQA